jgi:hypothetical protein
MFSEYYLFLNILRIIIGLKELYKLGGIDSEEEKVSRYFYVVYDGGRRSSRL